MPAKDMGVKYACFKCGTKFYDMKKPEPLCPKCGADQRQAAARAAHAEKRSRAPARPVEPEPEEVETPEVDADEEPEIAEEEEDDA